MKSFRLIASSFLLLLFFQANAQETLSEYAAEIKKFTTDERFLPKSLLGITEHSVVPSPLKHFGHIIGAEGKLHRSSEIFGYYQKLAESSPRVHMQAMGQTEEGRTFYVVVVGDEAALNNLDYYKNQTALLAYPRKISSQNLEEVLSSSKPIYYVSAGMHATEMGAPEMLMEMAYRLATSDEYTYQNIRNKVITVINPIMEPDGWDKQVDWYYRYTKGREHFDDGFPRSVPYWGKYVFHDNNRDGLQISQAITQSIFKGFFEFHPTVMLDLHESVPLLYISTGTGPYNDFVDPITQSEWQVMANHDVAAVASQGMPGAFTWAFYDGWWPGYGIWVANNHNSNGRFYETYGNAGADTYLRDLSNAKFAGDDVTSKQWYRPDPATAKVNWSFRNNINYTMVGVLASLSYAADNDRLLLRNFYQKGLNSLEKGRKEGPKAFLIPKDQRDPAMGAYLASQLMRQGIEMHETETDFVALSEQPYRNLLVSLMTPQSYPKDAKYPPYDAIAWTLPYLYGVETNQKDSLDFNPKTLTRVTELPVYKGKVAGDGEAYVISYQAQADVLPALYESRSKARNLEIYTIGKETVIGNDTLPAGSIWMERMSNRQATELADQFGLDFLAFPRNQRPSDASMIKLPRVAIYHTWYNTQDEGWSRFTFDQKGIPYTSIDKDDLKQGNLKSRFDVILVPRVRGNAKMFVNGIDQKFGPMSYTKTADFPSHGLPASTNDMTGGPGLLGIDHLKKFVEAGGLLLSFENSSMILSELGLLPELSPVNTSGLFHPGSLVRAKKRNADTPVLYGYPESFSLFRGNGPLLQTNKYNRDMMLAQYGFAPLKDEVPYDGPILGLPKVESEMKEKSKKEKHPNYVIAGMVRNEQEIIGHGALFAHSLGNGKVLAFTFDPLHRYLNLHEAPMVWNALIHWERIVLE